MGDENKGQPFKKQIDSDQTYWQRSGEDFEGYSSSREKLLPVKTESYENNNDCGIDGMRWIYGIGTAR